MSKKLIIDKRYFKIAEQKWGKAFEIIPSPAVENLPEPVRSHPDLSLIRIGGMYIVEKTVYDFYKTQLPGKNVICGETALGSHYPFDIAYNVLISGNIAMANFKYTDNVIKKQLVEQNFKLIDVKQGYAYCSSAVFDNHIITADPSVAEKAALNGLDVLRITPGGIRLPGYGYGFIGGASGFVDGKLLFFGDITQHADFEKIKRFTKSKNIEMDYLKDFPLTDVGTMIGIVD